MDKQIALEEFIRDYQNNDLIKAKAVMDCLGELGKEEQRRIIFELVKLDDNFSVPILAYLLHKQPTLVVEYPQIRNVLFDKTINNPGLVLNNLVKIVPETAVFVELVVKDRLKEAIPRLRQFLNQSGDRALLQTTINSLGVLKDENAIGPIGDFLMSEDDSLQTAAIQALGDIGTHKSLQLLFDILGKIPDSNEKILTIFTTLRTEPAIHLLNQTLISTDAEIRTLGKSKLIEIGGDAIPILTKNLLENHPDLQIHTLNILMEIGDQHAVKAIRQLLNTEPENDNVRFAAYEALAHLPSLKGDYLLATGLSDRDDSIRLAAAKAINGNLDPALTTGIKNMVRSENAEAVRIIKAIVDAETTDLFVACLEVPFFQRISTEYIATKVHRDIRQHYLNLLAARGLNDTATAIEQSTQVKEEQKTRPLICAVDDSVMILSVYRRVINELGFEPVLFEFPEECLFWLAENKPALVFTDLNMPKITGIELARRIREQYNISALPIVMVTTQQEGKDDEALKRVGINRVMSKPFDTESVEKILKELSIVRKS